MNIEFERLNINGMSVIIEKRKVPVACVMIGVKVGGINESERTKGISHAIEHMVFKGTKTRSQQKIAKSIEKIGGYLNAFTSEEITVFYCKIPAKHVCTGIEILCDIISNPTFPQQELVKEKKVILEEIKMVHDTPTSYLFRKIKSMLYEKPFGLPIIGKTENVKNFTRADLIRWHNKYYVKNNIMAVVVGNVSSDDIKQAIKQNLKLKERSLRVNHKIKRINKHHIEKRKHLKQAHLAIGIHMPTATSRLRYACILFDTILGEGMSSRLFQEIREKRGLAYAIKSDLDIDKHYGYLTVYAGTKKEDITNVKELALKEIRKLRELHYKDFEQAKEQVIGKYMLKIEDSEKTAEELLFEEHLSNAENFYRFEQHINDVKLWQVRSLAKIKTYSFAAIIPEQAKQDLAQK